MKYFESRKNKIISEASSKFMTISMILRIIILLVILITGKFFCEWATEKSYNHVEEWEMIN